MWVKSALKTMTRIQNKSIILIVIDHFSKVCHQTKVFILSLERLLNLSRCQILVLLMYSSTNKWTVRTNESGIGKHSLVCVLLPPSHLEPASHLGGVLTQHTDFCCIWSISIRSIP
ncbi:hypothetical protein ILYODFUR_031563 [Ilyodon furcidens]|uniref:Uncharacterized protein n=1 Tax=Ilyodon furcidens TaxID=33524 RepID=A0ABV0UY71_9TELE